MTFIVQDEEGNSWLPAYTGFNKVMGKNSLVIPFRTVFIDGEWYKVGEIDPEREAYPIEKLDIQAWLTKPDELVEEDKDE